MKAIAFASYIPRIQSLPAGRDFLDRFASDFQGYDIYVGINRPSVPEWVAVLKSYPKLNIEFAFVDESLTVDSDASAFQTALHLIKKSGKNYDLIWFGHTKGATSGNTAYRREFISKFFGQRVRCERYFDDPEVGCFGRYITATTTPGITDETLNSLFPFKYTAINSLFLHTFYILRGQLIDNFIHGCRPEFFERNLVRDLGFDRYFFERDFPNISDKMGLEPAYQKVLSHPAWNKVNQRRIDAMVESWRQQNSLGSRYRPAGVFQRVMGRHC